MTVGARATTSDEGVQKARSKDGHLAPCHFESFWISLLASSCEFQDSPGRCADREQTGSSCNDRDLYYDFYNAHAFSLASNPVSPGSIL